MDEIALQRSDLDFAVAKSIRYHAYRRSFWDNIDTIAKILTIVSGTAVLVSIVGYKGYAATILAFTVAITGALDVVLRFSQKARRHDSLYRAFSRLAQDLTTVTEVTGRDIAEWRRRRLEIEMDEPSVLDLLERRCSAEEARARGLPVNDAWKLDGWQTLLSQFIFWPVHSRDDASPSS